MSFDFVRRSFRNLFLLEKQPSKEPLKQESVNSTFSIEPNLSSYSYNKFQLVQKKKERFNPNKVALQRLIDFYQTASKIKDHDKLPVIVFEQKVEAKKPVNNNQKNNNRNGARWNCDDSSSECMLDSVHLRNQFIQNQAESQITNRQVGQQQFQKQAKIKQPQYVPPNFGPSQSRSTINFSSREVQQKPPQILKCESPEIKHTKESIELRVNQLTQVVESKFGSPVGNTLQIQQKINEQPAKQSVNKFEAAKKVEIKLDFNNNPNKIQEKKSTKREEIPKISTKPISPQKPKQVLPEPPSSFFTNPLPQETTQILPPIQPTIVAEQPQQNQIIQSQPDQVSAPIMTNPFIGQQVEAQLCPWMQPQLNCQPQVQSPQFPFQVPNFPMQQNVDQFQFQNQTTNFNLFQNANTQPQQQQTQNLFQNTDIQPQQQQTQNLFQSQPFTQPQMSNPLFENNTLFQQQAPLQNTQQTHPLFPFAQPQQQTQQQNQVFIPTNSLGGGSFRAEDNKPKSVVDLFQQQPSTNQGQQLQQQQQPNLFSCFDDKPVQQQNPKSIEANKMMTKMNNKEKEKTLRFG